MGTRYLLLLALVAGTAFAASCRSSDHDGAAEARAAAMKENTYVLRLTGIT